MKTMRHTLVALLTVLSASAFAFGGDSTERTVRILPSLVDKSYRIFYKAENSSPVRIKLYDAKKEVLYTRSYNVDSFVQPFDLSNLPDGYYTFKVFTDGGIIEEEVAAFETTVSFPSLNLNADGKNRVARLQTETPIGKSLRLLIYDQQGTKLHSEDLSAQKNLNKLYDLNKVNGSGVTFVILHENKVIKEKNIVF